MFTKANFYDGEQLPNAYGKAPQPCEKFYKSTSLVFTKYIHIYNTLTGCEHFISEVQSILDTGM